MRRLKGSLLLFLIFTILFSAGRVYAQSGGDKGNENIDEETKKLLEQGDEEFLKELEDIFQGDEELLKELKDELQGPDKAKTEKSQLIPMVFVKGGCFKMGDQFGVGDDDEQPVHEVCLEDYYISETEVTQAQWEAVMGFNPSKFKDPNKPVEYVSWNDIQFFLKKLNEQTGRKFRLPTEAEWEYAARERGKKLMWPGTNKEKEIDDYAWHLENSDMQTHPVKSKKPNALGIYDMAGNVWEWVYDYFDFDYYKQSPKFDPHGPDLSDWRGLRGGSFLDEPYKLRTTYRYGRVPPLRSFHIGIRLAE